VRPRDHVEEAECHSVGKGEPAKYGNGHHDPKPMMSCRQVGASDCHCWRSAHPFLFFDFSTYRPG